jgi:predicted nucleic acid-binding protein
MKHKVYIETSVISYLTAWRSRDIVIAGNQETTKEWWERRADFDIFISQFVLDEAAAGDAQAAAARLLALQDIVELEVIEQVATIGEELLIQTALPLNARLDALHVAIAALHGMNYLLTWNCKHIANPAQRVKIESVIRSFGFQPPIICTPQELLEV